MRVRWAEPGAMEATTPAGRRNKLIRTIHRGRLEVNGWQFHDPRSGQRSEQLTMVGTIKSNAICRGNRIKQLR